MQIAMAKKSYKRPRRTINENASCMWRLISFFGHAPRKQLSDREHGRDMPIGNGCSNVQLEELNKHINNVDGSRSGRESVKRLMEEEMSQEHPQRQMSTDDVQSMISDLGIEVESRKNFKQTSKKSKVILDAPADQLTASMRFDNHQSEIITPTERPSHDFDLSSLLVELYSYGNTCQETLDVSSNVINLYTALKAICEKVQIQLDEPELPPDQSHLLLRRALADTAKDFVSQNSVIEKQVIGQTYIQSKEVMDALQVLNSNKELLLKLFQDSILFKHIQDYQSSRIGKISYQCTENIQLLEEESCNNSGKYGDSDSTKPLHRQSKYRFLWKKDKTKETQPLKEGPSSHSFRRIVVLRPNPSRIQNHSIISVANSSPQSHHKLGHGEDEENVVSYFSLSQIKRKLKRVFGERKREKHAISLDGVLHKIPIGSKDSSVTGKQLHSEPSIVSSARKSSADGENPFDTSENFKNKDKKLKQEKHKRTINNDGASSIPGHLIYEEAKKHIAELLTVDQTDSLPTGRVSRSLARLLLFPEDNVSVSPRSSLQGQQEITLSSQEPGCSLVEQILAEETINLEGPSSQNLEKSFGFSDDLNDRVKKLHPRSGLASNDVEDNSRVPQDFNSEGNLDATEADGIIGELSSHQLEPLSKLSEEFAKKIKGYEEELSVSSVHIQDLSEDKSENLNEADCSPDSPTTDNSFAADNTIKGQEKLSPVSVFQTTYSSEDIASPECTTMDHCKLRMQIFNVEDNDNPSRALMSLDMETIRACSNVSLARSQYIRALLEASGLTSNTLSERWLLADQLLDSSLFDEVEPSLFPQDDKKLLFDCISEVLLEIQERFYICSSNMSFIGSIRPAPSGEKLIEEVTKGIEQRIMTHSPKPVDEIIKMDLGKEEWVDLRFETKNIVIDIWCTVVDVLLEETVFDLWF